MKAALASASGRSTAVGEGKVAWKASEAGAWIEHRKVRYSVPASSTVLWPVLPHNPYRKDGRADTDEGRIVLDVPLAAGAQKVTVEVR